MKGDQGARTSRMVMKGFVVSLLKYVNVRVTVG